MRFRRTGEKRVKAVEEMTYEGINKPLAKKALVDYLDDIVKRFEKDVDVYEIE